MNVLDLLKPETLQGVTYLFLIGYVFRHVEGQVRNRRKETELQNTILSVCWSLVIFALLRPIQRPIPSAIPKELHLGISIGSFLLASAVMGFSWGKFRLWLPKVAPWVEPSGYAQTVMSMIRASDGAYVEIKLGDEWYQGMIWHFDRDAERFLDLHITMRHPAKLIDGEWQSIPAQEMMFNLKDVKLLLRL